MADITRRDFTKLALTGGTCAVYNTALPQPVTAKPQDFPEQPNVILIMTDDQGYGELGCHGNNKIKTPNLDRFYDESVRLRHFFVSPTCSPTRAALLTGRHEFKCGISHTILGRSLLKEDEVTIAEILREAGYRTGIFGKWHLGDNYPCRPMDRGFEECLYHGGGGITQTPDYWGNTYFNPTLNHNGRWKKTGGYCTDVYFTAALDWIEKNRDNPFFVYITPNAPHTPLQVSEKYSQPYEEMGLDTESAKFYGMITNIDENVGRLVRRIQKLGIEENTLIIFLTDNGSAQACRHNLFNAGMLGCKGTAHEGGVRVPCFFRWPGTLKGGVDINNIAAHVDMMPTLAGLCGADLPEDTEFDGMSLIPLLSGKEINLPDRYFFTHRGRWPVGESPDEYKYSNCSIRSRKFRLVDNRELYDMESDPGQTTDVIDKYPDAATEMREAYDRWWLKILPRVETPQRIKLGSPAENPSHLTCMDWQASQIAPGEPDWRKVPIWMQSGLEALARGDTTFGGRPLPGGAMGSWAVEIVRDGEYSVILRKLPSTAPEELNALKIGEAHFKCGGITESEEITEGETSVTFKVRLLKGPAGLECWFTGQRADGIPSGAYFVEVKYIG